MRAGAERSLERALAALSKALNESRAPWMVIGGIAVIAWGVRRFTSDIDAAVRGDAVPPEKLLAILGKHGIVSRITDAVRFADANLVLLLRHEPTGVNLDVSFAWSAFEHAALGACTRARFGKVLVPLCGPEDLVVFKAIAARPKDLEDAEALLALYPGIDIARARSRVAELAALAEEPHLLTTFDAIAQAGRTTSLPRRRRNPKKPKKRIPSRK